MAIDHYNHSKHMDTYSNLFSLYLHWPFCSSKCHYCDFVAYEQHFDYQEKYHHALIEEINAFVHNNPDYNKNISTVFLGGGTPSLYPLPWTTDLVQHLKRHFNMSALSEFTIETNPADITEEKLEHWRELGINRLSMGVQSLDDDVLIKLNRRQRNADVMRALRIAPKYFDNISIDLILGLPGIKPSYWLDTIKQAVNWPINHLSMYFLTVHEKTPLYFSVQQGQVSLPHDDVLADLYEKTVDILDCNGIQQYEISNFARRGYASLHNQGYWNRSVYKGFGVGASSFDGKSRIITTNNLSTYLATMPGKTQPVHVETLTPQQVLLEQLMLGLRQKPGIRLQHVLYFLDDDALKTLHTNISTLRNADLVEETDGTITLTSKGMAIENEIVIHLLQNIDCKGIIPTLAQ